MNVTMNVTIEINLEVEEGTEYDVLQKISRLIKENVEGQDLPPVKFHFSKDGILKRTERLM